MTLKSATCLALVLLVLGCAIGRPAFTPISAEKFVQEPLAVTRMHVLLNMHNDYQVRVAEPLGTEFVAALQKIGIEATKEFQVVNPLALDSGIRLDKARTHHPTAILVIRLGGSVEGAMGSYWKLRFDLLDEKGKGFWRGMTTLYRLGPMPETANRLAMDLVRKLGDESVIIAPEQNSVLLGKSVAVDSRSRNDDSALKGEK